MQLQLNGVTKHFGGIEAVNDLTINVLPGTITGLIGPNGAGKTTVINLITGMLALTRGSVSLGSEDLTTASPARVARHGISRTFQNIRLLGEASVLDNVIVGFHRVEKTSAFECLLGLPAAWRESRALRDRARELLGRFDMTRFAEYPASELAYGHQRRVEIMRALAAEPRILLLDEPVAGMNDVEAAELGAILAQLAKSGLGILLVEHNVRFVSTLCSHIHVLAGGRLLKSGAAAAVLNDPVVIEAYLGS